MVSWWSTDNMGSIRNQTVVLIGLLVCLMWPHQYGVLGKGGGCPYYRLYTVEECAGRSLCLTDEDCPANDKCCFSYCGATCSTPLISKSGHCPDLTTVLDTCERRQDTCSSDDNCPDSRKCCYTECGRICLTPAVIKRGVCPLVFPYDQVMCESHSNGCSHDGQCPGGHSNGCSHDGQCPGGEICCHTACGRQCSHPAILRLGSCPASNLYDAILERVMRVLDGGAPLPAVNLCRSDADCSEPQKCCYSGTGRVCADPSSEPAIYTPEMQDLILRYIEMTKYTME